MEKDKKECSSLQGERVTLAHHCRVSESKACWYNPTEVGGWGWSAKEAAATPGMGVFKVRNRIGSVWPGSRHCPW